MRKVLFTDTYSHTQHTQRINEAISAFNDLLDAFNKSDAGFIITTMAELSELAKDPTTYEKKRTIATLPVQELSGRKLDPEKVYDTLVHPDFIHVNEKAALCRNHTNEAYLLTLSKGKVSISSDQQQKVKEMYERATTDPDVIRFTEAHAKAAKALQELHQLKGKAYGGRLFYEQTSITTYFTLDEQGNISVNDYFHATTKPLTPEQKKAANAGSQRSEWLEGIEKQRQAIAKAKKEKGGKLFSIIRGNQELELDAKGRPIE